MSVRFELFRRCLIQHILFYNQTFSQIEINNLQTFLQRKYFGITSLGPSIAIGSQAGQISQGRQNKYIWPYSTSKSIPKNDQ